MLDLYDQVAGVYVEFGWRSSLEGCAVACVEPAKG